MYDEEQFRSRFRLNKDGFGEILNIIEADISAHNDRGNPIPAEIKILLTLRYYATVAYLNRLQVALLSAYLRHCSTKNSLYSISHCWYATTN